VGLSTPLNRNPEKVQKAAIEAKRAEEAEATAKDTVPTSNPERRNLSHPDTIPKHPDKITKGNHIQTRFQNNRTFPEIQHMTSPFVQKFRGFPAG